MKHSPMKNIDFIAVHCSATPASAENVDADTIRGWHRRQGWRDIGYHYVITRQGEVQFGRPETMRGAHERKINSRSVSICLVGGSPPTGSPEHRKGLGENNFTDEQWLQLTGLVHTLSVKYPDAEIIGHRDVPGVAKACPSFNVKPWWAKVTAFLEEHGHLPADPPVRGE